MAHRWVGIYKSVCLAAMISCIAGVNAAGQTPQSTAAADIVLENPKNMSPEAAKVWNSPQMLRLQSGFMRVILRTINLRVERAENEKRAIEKARETLHEVAERMRKEFQIAFEGDEFSTTETPKVTGAFDAGVRILGDPYLLSASANVKGSVLLTPLTEGPKTYARDAGRIVELH